MLHRIPRPSMILVHVVPGLDMKIVFWLACPSHDFPVALVRVRSD
ncbi:hypothetical protein L810_7264 [Burkholderia sp. AU4i]|nr:hypothetical protein L810_7264 [Burkholderia sp. AU4i]MDW9231809.1 hypothetical protein [Burkholderia cepacia]MDW9247937.1 hypothetical protein [Burkholderia cepacia]QOH37191.1 hypothetical protein C7S14_1012 [Burkholderia cepacia]